MRQVLAHARAQGFLGPGDPEIHVEHADAFLGALGDDAWPALDLGSGGGVPGLVLAVAVPVSEWVLLDASARRTAFLEQAVGELELGERVRVVRARAEELGHDPAFRGRFRTVTARSFGPPSVTAECAAPFLAVGGRLLVSEPPDPFDRWAAVPVAKLGLRWEARLSASAGTVARLIQQEVCPPRYPRRAAAIRRGL